MITLVKVNLAEDLTSIQVSDDIISRRYDVTLANYRFIQRSHVNTYADLVGIMRFRNDHDETVLRLCGWATGFMDSSM